MAILFSAQQLSKAYSGRTLFDGLSFGVNEKERVALIGANGAGKSTLLKILAGREEADSGDIAFRKGIRIGYLDQSPRFDEGMSIQQVLESRALNFGMDVNDWEVQAKLQEVVSLVELHNSGSTLEDKVQSLSGGWKKRVALARELLINPDLLLLDEPTNHLDIASIQWLEKLLTSSRFSVVCVTHDRAFLQNVSNVIFEVDKRNDGGILRVEGSYADYCALKTSQIAEQEVREDRLKNTLRREVEWLNQGAKARTTKQVARIKRSDDLKAEVESIEEKNRGGTARLQFQSSKRNPRTLLSIKGAEKSLGGKLLFSDLELEISRGSRIGIVGPNGSGKTSLIKSLIGEVELDKGELRHSENLQYVYFEQDRGSLDLNATLRENLSDGDYVKFNGSYTHVQSYLDRFLFPRGHANLVVSKLSGGEQARLLIARLMLQDSNLMILDEPTNDLDIPTLNVLQEQLEQFPGAVILVCHDRYFVDQVCDLIVGIHPGPEGNHIQLFSGLDQWQAWEDDLTASEAAVGVTGNVLVSKKKSPVEPVKKKTRLGYLEKRELDGMQAAIEKAESELNLLVEKSNSLDPASVEARETFASIAKQQESVEALYLRWDELETKQNS